MKVLITAGGTKEYIDGVRYIGNSSSGKTGANIADYLSSLGHEVTWLGANSAIRPQSDIEQLYYETFDDLAATLQQALANNHYDVVFHAAAVSDFKVAAVLLNGQKLEAGRDVKLPTADAIQLKLTKQPKLLSSLKHWSSNKDLKVVAFKLTNSTDEQVRQSAVEKLTSQSAVDLVAHNDLQQISQHSHAFNLYKDLQTAVYCADAQALVDAVLQQLEFPL